MRIDGYERTSSAGEKQSCMGQVSSVSQLVSKFFEINLLIKHSRL